MDGTKETYRQYMIGQLQVWEGEIARLKAGAGRLEADSRLEYARRLRELERCNRDVFGRYEDLLLAGEDHWDEMQIALDAAAYGMREMLEEFTPQPA